MSAKTIRAFSLSLKLVDRLQAFALRLQFDTTLADRLNLPPTVVAPRIASDVRGLTPEDYTGLRKLIGAVTSLKGDDLLDHGLNNPATRGAAYGFIRAAQVRNAKIAKNQNKELTGRRRTNLSRAVETLLTFALENLENTKDAAINGANNIGGRKSRDARKIA